MNADNWQLKTADWRMNKHPPYLCGFFVISGQLPVVSRQ
jgi:hypothetical protein